MGSRLDTIFYGFDTAIYPFFGAMQSNVMNYVAKTITFFGSAKFLYILLFATVLLCIFKKTRKYGVALLFSLAIGVLTANFVLKPWIMRVRPYITLQSTPFWDRYELWYTFAGSVTENNYSFPSGHTTLAFSAATPIFLTGLADKKKWVHILPIFATLVGLSRIYLMVHYPSDVLFGFIMGVVAGILGYLIAKRLFKERKIISA